MINHNQIITNCLPPDAVTKAVVASGVVSAAQIVPPIRIPLDDNLKPRGFAYVELVDESLVEGAVRGLKGMEVGGRVARSDYADPERKKEGLREEARRGGGDSSPSAYTSRDKGTVRDLLNSPSKSATFARASLSAASASASAAAPPLWKKKDPAAPAAAPGRQAEATLYLGNLSYKVCPYALN